jgi:uncharacterized surface protein with fasciclin (FAS1) repeats
LSLTDGKVILTDANGGTSTVIADVAASNGVIHAIDSVLCQNKVLIHLNFKTVAHLQRFFL